MIWHHKTHSHHAKLVPNNMSVAGSSQPGFRITASPGMIHAYFVLVPSSGFEYFSQTIIHGLSHTLSPSPVARVCYTDTPWDIALLCLPVEPVEPVNDLCWGSKKGWVIVSISENLSGTGQPEAACTNSAEFVQAASGCPVPDKFSEILTITQPFFEPQHKSLTGSTGSTGKHSNAMSHGVSV